ncbi:MAG: TRAP transporter substrate-binding protein [Marivibrio sp.]|uniref:TRAP transporter substrate-binding protein n=1 Tax=Marivibrio sp. TaxID=2039719 RepID=UPI0032EEE531
MTDTPTADRRRFLKGAGLSVAGVGALSAPLAAPTVARADAPIRWRMVTSWPKNSPGPGTSAARLAERIEKAADGRLQIELHAAGELVPALEVFDAVAQGAADMAHTASVYWTGKNRAASFFTTVPFGLSSREHAAWIYHGGGQQLWDDLYADFGLKGFMAGETGMQMAGWFKRPIESLEDVKGLRVRIVGLGGEILRRMGGAPATLPAGEIFTALQSGVVDGAEFLNPWIDEAFGFYKAAPYYAWPGFNKPNGTGELLVARDKYDGLPEDLKLVVEEACRAEHAYALAEADWKSAAALDRLESERGVTLFRMPDDVIAEARRLADPVVEEAMADERLGPKILKSYRAAQETARRWSSVGVSAYFQARAA